MQITELPFNKLINLELSDKEDYLLKLSANQAYTNHLNTVHAAALFALAEATSGQFLLIHFPAYGNNLIPVVRKVTVKYKKPATGAIYSKANLVDINVADISTQLATKKRVSFTLHVELFDTHNTLVFDGHFEWFVSVLEQ
ncbi:MAG: YiiD C-terminal domain-containing protein [Bacteroidota bacterium]